MKDNPGYLVLLDFYEESQSIRTRFYCPPGFRVLDALNELIIRKETVQFVTADDGDAGRGFGLSPDRNHYRIIEKLPVMVDIQIKAYRLTGKMHQIRKGRPEDTVDDYVFFLPLTDVTIVRDLKVIAEKPFTAVNKKYILSIKEADAQDLNVPEQSN